jgi:hypothetical protein
MNWRRVSPWCRESDCGTWSIAKIGTGDRVTYECWQKVDGKWVQVRINIKTYETAQRFCESRSKAVAA